MNKANSKTDLDLESGGAVRLGDSPVVTDPSTSLVDESGSPAANLIQEALKQPFVRFFLFASFIVAGWNGIGNGLQSSGSPDGVWLSLAKSLTINAGTVGVASAMAVGQLVLFKLVRGKFPATGSAGWYLLFGIGGLLSGLARYSLVVALDFRFMVLDSWQHGLASHAAVVSVGGMVIAFVAHRYYNYVEKIKHQDRELLKYVAQIKAHQGQLTAAQERSRREIADHLHGHVQTRLLSLSMNMTRAAAMVEKDPVRAGRIIADSQQEIDQIRDVEIRQVSHLLHPSIIRIGLLPAVRNLLSSQKGALNFELKTDDKIAAWDDMVNNRFPEETRLVAYRVIEEAIGNVLKHAQATVVTVSMSVEGDRDLVVSIADDGRGFDPAAAKSGLGLSSIAARAHQAEGKWEILSRPGEGTKVSIRLPLNPNR